MNFKTKIAQWLSSAGTTFKKPPPQKEIIELPVFPWPTWETVETVRGSLINLQFGRIRDAALLWDAMLGDDRIGSAIRKRSINLLGLPMEFDPANSSPIAGRMASELELRWWQMFPENSLSELLEWGIGIGVGIGQLVWEPSGGEWIQRLRVWHPANSYYDMSTRRFVIITQNAGNIQIEPDDPEWLVFTPYGADNKFWRHALIRSLSILWLIRKWAVRDWARFSEVHGLPIRKGFVPPDATKIEKDDFWQAMQRISSESVFRLPLRPNGEKGFDIELLEAKSESWKGIQELKHECDAMIDIDVLGQNLTTQVSDKGSFAASKTHAKTENKNTMFDGQQLTTFLRNGPIKWWSGWNYPSGEDIAPWARWQIEEPEDLDKKSEIWLRIAQAAGAFNDAGVAVDWQAAAEDFNIPLRGDGILDLQSLPGGLQGGNEDEVQPAENPTGPDEPGSFSTAHPTTEDKLAGTSRKLGRSHHLQGQIYVDALHDRAITKGASLLSSEVRAIAKAVASSSTPDELRRRLKREFASSNPDDFAKLMQRAILMACLAGRASAKR